MSPNALICWSGGKDSALALYAASQDPSLSLVGLISTVTGEYERVSMHGVRRELLEQQANSLGLALRTVVIPRDSSEEEYDNRFSECLRVARSEGVGAVVFGDIHLAGVREYREDRLSRVGVQPVFPLWGQDTRELARRFVALGFRGTVTCVDTSMLDAAFAGRDLDEAFFGALPATTDPCGENGEYHSFVWDGPLFSRPVEFSRGEIVLRQERFCYCDLVPAATRTKATCREC